MREKLEILKTMFKEIKQKHRQLERQFYSNSEKWQDSEIGLAFLDKMNDLEHVRDDIEMTYEMIELYIEEWYK